MKENLRFKQLRLNYINNNNKKKKKKKKNIDYHGICLLCFYCKSCFENKSNSGFIIDMTHNE